MADSDSNDRSAARERIVTRGPRPRVRQQVLDAARHLISTSGYSACTVDALVSVSGVSKTTVYRWWANRAHVALDAMFAGYGWPVSGNGEGAPVARLRNYLRAEAEYCAGPAGVILRGVVADAQLRPPLAETLRTLYLTPRRESLEALLREGRADGTLRADVDVPAASALLSTVLVELLLGVDGLEPTDLADRLLDTVLGGIAADPRRQHRSVASG